MTGPKTTLLYQEIETTTSDGLGGSTITWMDVQTYTGVLIELNGEELLYAGRIADNVTHYFYIPYQLGILLKSAGRFTTGTRTFNILRIGNPDNQRRNVRIFLREII